MTTNNLKIENIQTDHHVENEVDLGQALTHHLQMARLGGLVPDPNTPIEISLKDIRLNEKGKPIITIETKAGDEKP